MDAAPRKKARREPNFSEEEKMCLLQFVQQHKLKLFGRAGRPGHGDSKVEERKARYWQLCANAIKAAGGRERDWRKVKKQWFDLKDKAKKFKSDMSRTGGGPKPVTSPSIELALEVVATESLEGIKGRSSELDPMGREVPELSDLSQNSSQESVPEKEEQGGSGPSAASTSTAAESAEPCCSLVALQQQVNCLQAQVEELSAQRSQLTGTLPRSTELRMLKYNEELLRCEKIKIDLQRQSVELQKQMLLAIQSLGANSLLRSMTEQ